MGNSSFGKGYHEGYFDGEDDGWKEAKADSHKKEAIVGAATVAVAGIAKLVTKAVESKKK